VSAKTWEGLIDQMRQVLGAFLEPRTGDNCTYSMKDIACSAFSVFFTQFPSFLPRFTDLAHRSGTGPF
jgi:hypothetical protein